jgi:oxygen-independent coproporphyrinogen-3 oxidase
MPWCVRKCPYCDFNSHRAPDALPQREYVAALLEDLDLDLAKVVDRPLISIFFGGGTPSLFAPEEIATLLAGVRERIAVGADVEITLEANPGTIERGRFSGYRDAGVNRVSLGVQSFNDSQLRALGRIHSRADVERAIDELQDAGLENFNLDLMYGLPEQTIEQAIQDIERAIDFRPAHISHYQLTLEPGTAFHRRPPALPDADLIWEMQLAAQERLASRGYRQYEISAYAADARRCRHNLNYWEFGDYLGIGAGAHGKITTDGMNIKRTARIRSPHRYLSSSAAERLESSLAVPANERPFEFMLNALRLVEGVDRALFESRTGLTVDSLNGALAQARQRGLIEVASDQWVPTELGRRFLNELQALFLASECSPSAPSQTSSGDVTERASS